MIRTLWIVGKCFLVSWSFEHGHVPCYDQISYEVFGSSANAMKYIEHNEGSWNLMEVNLVKEQEFETVETSSTSFRCEWPRPRKPE